MASRNVDTLRAAHENWNRRNFDGCVRDSAENVTYTDHARNQAVSGRENFRALVESWAQGMSDGKITNPRYIDAGETVITQFTVEGTNDGPIGDLPPTGKRAKMEVCEICRFDKQGRMVGGDCYYDQYALLAQLGHVRPFATAA